MTFEYEIGDQVEIHRRCARVDGTYGMESRWLPATVIDRFYGPLSNEPVYVVDGDEGYYAFDVRPLPQSLRVPDEAKS